jgi:hypothetical protein
MGMLAEATGSETVGDGLVLGLVTGVGFAATIALITATFETTKPNALVWARSTAATISWACSWPR